MEENTTALRAEVEQLRAMVESLAIEMMQNNVNNVGANVGVQMPMMPVIGGGDGEINGRYEIDNISVIEQEEGEENENQEPSTASITFSNPYYRAGGKTYTGGTTISDVELPAIIALKVNITGATPSAQLVSYSSLAALQTAETNKDYYIHPLYKIGETGSVECDFRIGPESSQWEFGGQPT